MNDNVLPFPAGRTVGCADSHPELDLLSAGQLLDFRRYYLWRIDTLFLLALSDQVWFDHGDRQEYHQRQLSEELAFCESCICAIELRLNHLGV
jgi:hypothetical protein